MSLFKPAYKQGEEVWWRHPDGIEVELRIDSSKVRWRLKDILPQRYYCGQLRNSGSYSMNELGTFLMNVRERDLRKKSEGDAEG